MGMSVYGCVRCFNGDIINGVDYIVKEIGPDQIVVDVDPQYNLSTPEEAEAVIRQLQPYVAQVAALLQAKPMTTQELSKSRLKGLSKSLARCFPRDKPLNRWLSFVLLFPESFAVSGNTVSVPDAAEEDGNNTVDTNKIPKRVVLTREDVARKCRLAYARCYYTVQGETCRDKHRLLLDTSHKHFDMRELIVGKAR